MIIDAGIGTIQITGNDNIKLQLLCEAIKEHIETKGVESLIQLLQ